MPRRIHRRRTFSLLAVKPALAVMAALAALAALAPVPAVAAPILPVVPAAEAEPPSAEAETPVAAEPVRSSAVRSIDPPAPPGAILPTVASEGATTFRKGHDVLVTWLEPDEDGGRLRFGRYSLGAWQEPITISGGVGILDPADPPSLTVFETQAVRRTLIARTGDTVARSGDAGRTWSRLPAPPLPYSSFAGGDEGGYAFWLEGDGDGQAALLGTRILAGESRLDRKVAAGSGTAAAMTWDGPVVVYRDLGNQRALDIGLVRRENARWTRPRPVHVEGWRPGRRVASGPRIAALRRDVAIAWYTEDGNRPRVMVAFSKDAGRTVGAPVEVDAHEPGDPGRGPGDRLDVALDEAGRALVVWWAERDPGETALLLARVAPDGQRGEPLLLSEGTGGGPADGPRIARAGERVAVTWAEGTPSRVRVVTVPSAAIPAPEGSPTVTAEADPEPDLHLARGRIGEPVPQDLQVLSLDGEEVSLGVLEGRPVLLNLWATWCMPCIAEMPELAALHERYGPEGLEVVGLSVDEEEAADAVDAFVAEHGIPFTVWHDPGSILYRALWVRALPATFVIDRTGEILFRRDGVIEADDPAIEAAVERALGER